MRQQVDSLLDGSYQRGGNKIPGTCWNKPRENLHSPTKSEMPNLGEPYGHGLRPSEKQSIRIVIKE